jgi:D-amino-acid dehydrogenase
MRVCVLGAGIVGLATAWRLNHDGHEVVVVDGGAPGAGASGGNGAQLSYSYVAPLADPALWRQIPKLLVSRASPLKIRPSLDPAQLRWLVAFLGACNAGRSRATTATLLALARTSREEFETMRVDVAPDCDYAEAGKLVLYTDAESLKAGARQVEIQRELGAVQQVLTAADSVAIEPALASYRANIAGAVYTPSECVVDGLKLCQALACALEGRGVEFRRAAIERFAIDRGRVRSVLVAGGAIGADAFVLALGAASAGLARALGVSLPVYPLKGYSVTLDLSGSPAHAAPLVSVTDSARKTVFARIGERLRVAGMVELVGDDASLPAARIETLLSATRAVFPDCPTAGDVRPWSGFRPATPTGVPILGRVAGAPENVLFNTGHGALGLTMAFGSAATIADALGKARRSARATSAASSPSSCNAAAC